MHGVAKPSGVRRCVRRGTARGAGAALRGRLGIAFRLFLEIFACVVTLWEARRDCLSQCNACFRCGGGARVVRGYIGGSKA